ncbi:MAG: RidA family protein [Clostridiaceae bacterium]|nr:RidA family protein [Clostridiaceae bacterium]
MNKAIKTDKAPKAIGPYSQGIDTGMFIFSSGQIPINPSSGEVAGENIEEQTRQVLDNLKNVLLTGGSDLSKVIKTTVFIKDMNHFSKVNEIYAQYFSEPYPASSCIEVSRLPWDVLIEIAAVALK